MPRCNHGWAGPQQSVLHTNSGSQFHCSMHTEPKTHRPSALIFYWLLLYLTLCTNKKHLVLLTLYPLHTVKKRAAVFKARLFNTDNKEKGVAVVAAGFLIHPSCGGLAAAAACDHQPWPVRMLRTQRKEEEEVEVEGGYIYPSLPHRSEGWSTPNPSDLTGAQKHSVTMV